ncbi:hypothetical protein WVIC16_130210 [Weissella viridescens]|nr:hypothetical protein WVIC16_130210 [Weissella viridescens]
MHVFTSFRFIFTFNYILFTFVLKHHLPVLTFIIHKRDSGADSTIDIAIQ